MAVEERVDHGQGSAAPVADIRLESVTKRFDDVAAVDDVSLEIPRGSFFALLGPSGCGKTTSLRMIGGFEEPTAGTIYLGDRDVTGLPPYKRDVNTVFQSYALFPHLNIFENVAFGLRRRGSARRRAERARLRVPDARRPGRLRAPQAAPALGRPAAARRPGARARQPAARAAPRRAARRARPQAPQADAARAQADPARGRHHVRARHARPGRGHDDGRHDRRHARGQDRAARDTDRAVRDPADGVRRRLPGHLQPPRRHRRSRRERCRLADGTVVRVSAASGQKRGGLASASGRRKCGSAPCEENRLAGEVRESAYIGVSTQYIVDTTAGAVTLYVQNTEAGATSVRPGDQVTLSWSPEATFVVD